MKVYLIRHAQSEENVLNLRERTSASAFNAVLRRSPDSPLTEQGRQEALDIIRKLAGEPISHLYSSPFVRALTTATIIGEALGLTPEVVDELREVMPNPLRETPRLSSVRRFWLRSYLRMWLPHPVNETWPRAFRRARAVWGKITAEQHDTVVAVSHRGLISLILLSLRRSRQWQILSQDLSNGGISLVVSKETR